MTQAGSQNRNLGPLLIILTVLVVAVLGYLVQEGKLLAKFSFGTSPKPFHLKDTAREGSVVDGFPMEFVSLIRDAKVIESALYEGEQAEIRRVIYRTSAKIPDLFAAYVNYFTDRGYTLSEVQSKGGITGMVAEAGREEEIRVDMYLSSARTTDVRIDILVPVIE
jgi:hypothetical protein